MAGQDLVSTVTTDRTYGIEATAPKVGTVVAYDFGIKRDILDALNRRGLDVVVVPASTSASEALALEPDAVFLSNGPGDPEPLTDQIAAVRSLLGTVPVFGICLGHQVLGLALGATTFKLPFGHHGGNHPVRRISDGTVEITSQNHGFAVDLWSLTIESHPWPTASRRRTCCRARGHRVRSGQCEPPEPERRDQRGNRMPRRVGVLGAIPP